MEALQSQINPHFLVNTLGSMRFMAMVAKFDSIKNMAEALINILSTSFRQAASLYTINEELEMLESYIYLMKIRYAENFLVEYRIDDNCRRCLIPRLVLQPIVENCIVHGFEDSEDIGHILVEASRNRDAVVITISDDGQGMSPERLAEVLSASIGISNVQKRVRLNFGELYGVRIESKPGAGTRVTLTIPATDKEGADVQPVDC